MRCIWDGRSSLVQSSGSGGAWQETVSQEARVHGVMRSVEPATPGSDRTAAQTQHIFELIPTIPLGLPERISSPTANSFSQNVGLGM
jgi:RHO1 GDP-GTP exchange protein 1/2